MGKSDSMTGVEIASDHLAKPSQLTMLTPLMR
jgi:hypothetical protein